MAQLRITDSADSEKASLPVSDYSIKREGFNVIPEAEVAVARELLNEVGGLTPGEDRAYIEEGGSDTFGGILRSPDRQGGVSVLKVRGKAQYFVRAPSVPTGQQKVNADDSTLVKEAIDQTPQLTAGTINTVEAGQTWVFGGISQWEKAKKVANAAGGEIEVESDGTVNYTAQRGSDKTTTTLSPSEKYFVEDTFVVSRDGISGNTTHLLVTGVGSGTSQIEVAIVPDDDTTTYSQYDRVATYTNDSWSDGDPAIWGTPRGNKELKNGDLAESYGKKLINELQSEEVRIDTTVKGNTVNLGDTFHVFNEKEGVDENLRAVEVVELLSASGGNRYETVFSNYEFAHRDASREDHKDTRNYNSGAYEGDLTAIQTSPGRGPVDSGHDYVVQVYYPDDVVAEVGAQMNVSGQNFRAYSSGAASGGTTTSDQNTAYSKVVARSDSSDTGTTDTSFFTVDTYSPGLITSEVWGTLSVTVDEELFASARIYDQNNGEYIPDSEGATISPGSGTADPYTYNMTLGVPGNHTDNTLELQLSFGTSGVGYSANSSWYGFSGHRHNIDPHLHDPDPGILDWDGAEQSPEHYPSAVDIIVNGTSQGYALGDGTGPFQEVADLGGALSSGWNEIRLTSDSLGHLDSSFSADLFRQSL